MEQSAIVLGWNRNFLALKTSKTDWSTMEQSAIILGWNRPTVPVLFGILFKQPCEPDCLKKRHGGACLPAVSGEPGGFDPLHMRRRASPCRCGIPVLPGQLRGSRRMVRGQFQVGIHKAVSSFVHQHVSSVGYHEHNFLSFDTVEKPTLQHPVGHWV